MILLDTSGILSALFADQKHHEACARILRESAPPRILSPFVLAECDYLIQKYGGVGAELTFLGEISHGAYDLAHLDRFEVGRASDFVAKYRNLNIGLADASIVILAARFNCRDILTLDERHFRTIRFEGRRSFRILPSDAR